MKVKKIDDSSYIVQNEASNKTIKLGESEFLFLRSLREQKEEPEWECGLSGEQKEFLYGKFQELGFLDGETKKNKAVKDLSNINLIKFSLSDKTYAFLKIPGAMVSYMGLLLFALSLSGILLSFIFYPDSVIYGLNNVSFDLKTIILLFVMVLLTSVMHELFHAAACYKYAGSIAGMGIKLFYLMPVFYMDVSTIYMTNDKRKIFIVSAAGLMCNTFFAGASLVLYIFLQLRGMHCELLFYYFVFQFATIIRNMLPFERFDAYWMTVAASGIHNLYDKSIMMFMSAVGNIKKYRDLPLRFKYKVILPVYGFINLIFRWVFWGYCIAGLNNLFKKYGAGQAGDIFTIILYITVTVSSIRFIVKYIYKYKTDGQMMIMNI